MSKAKTYKEEYVSINPSIKARDAKYFLKIHHDFTVKEDLSELESSIGHFYIELTDTILNTTKLSGKYPIEGVRMTALNLGEIKEEEQRLNKSKQYMKKNNEEITLTTKVIPLTVEQYFRASMFLSSKNRGIYAAGIDDCICFTQEVYSAAGLPRHFTDVYTAAELISLGSVASKAAFARYGSRDSHIPVNGFSVEEVASKYHVSADRVIEAHSDILSERMSSQKQFIILSDKLLQSINGLKTLTTYEDVEDASAQEEDFGAIWAHNLIAENFQAVNAAFAVADGKIPASEFQSELKKEVDITNPDFMIQAKEAEDTLDWLKGLTLSTNASLFGCSASKVEASVFETLSSEREAKTPIVNNPSPIHSDDFDDILEDAYFEVFGVEESTRVDSRLKPATDVFQRMMKEQVESCREMMSLNPFLSAAAGLDHASFDQSYGDVMDILGVPIFPQENK